MSIEDIENQIRKIPLIERLENARKIIGNLASEGRYPKMSIPVQSTDEDVMISTTLADAMDLINSIRCHAGKDGDCNWTNCPQLKKYNPICPLHKNDEEE